jgi:hypothetical protein
MTYENPFVVYSPEQQSPENFKETFVKETTYINTLEAPIDVFIEGWRGSGKSSLLNYMEFSHQICFYNYKLNDYLNESRKNKYFGIMVHVVEDLLKTDKFDLILTNNLDHEVIIKNICLEDVVLTILFKVNETLLNVKEMNEFINHSDANAFKIFFNDLELTNNGNITDDPILNNTDYLRKLNHIFRNRRKEISEYALDKLQMKDVNYKKSNYDVGFLLGYLKNLKAALKTNDFSFYILFDNADELTPLIQMSLNELILHRSHDKFAIKVAVRKGAIWTYAPLESHQKLQAPHDFINLDVDELYSTKHEVYNSRIRDIATKRLLSEGYTISLEEFFPESPTEALLLQKIKYELREFYLREYDEKYSLVSGSSDVISKSDYITNRVSKYAQAELFRRIKKTKKSYAGFENIVHLSSGVIRQFLDLSSSMYEEERKRQGDKPVLNISLKSQNTVISSYADELMTDLEKLFTGAENDGDAQSVSIYKKLYNLIEALGKYYKVRLNDPKMKENRVFTFTLKDPNTDKEVQKILELGINMNYFQTYWYSSKIGIGKYRGYAFNRRLCPRYSIDHTSFRGRKELSTADIKTAMNTGILKPCEDKPVVSSTLDNYLESVK